MRDRFEREAQLLAKVSSPNVVGYVAHGQEVDRAWLALEWLEGEDLRNRQRRSPLRLKQALELARQAAEGLAILHDKGIVHRDIKPSNLFVCESDAGLQLKLIDLGVARVTADAALTQASLRIGTPAYMSPEQAAGAEHVGPSSDIYSLGVVLFELASGQRPYAANDVVALLAKIVLEGAPRMLELSPSTPAELDELLAKMLCKDPGGRFRSARALADALAALDVPDAPPPVTTTGQSRPPTHATTVPSSRQRGEQRVVTTLFLALPSGSKVDAWHSLEELATSHGAQTHRLLGGKLVAVFGAEHSRGDEALRAARVAVAAEANHPALRIAIATGRAITGQLVLTGPVIERGAQQLDKPAGGIQLDALSARLLEPHFDIEQHDDDHLLRQEHAPSTVSEPRVLGHQTPLLERDRELDALEDLCLESCQQQHSAAGLVVGKAGIGKSRLRYELLQRLSGWDEPPTVLIAQSDPILACIPLGLIAQALRSHAGIERGADGDTPRRTVAAWTRALDVANDELVCELLGVAASVEPELALARAEPSVMAARMKETAAELLRALAARQGTVLLLEDVQWADPSSIQLIDWVLDSLSDCPLCVIAWARPAVDERFAGLWSSASPLRIDLQPLTRRACKKLVLAVLNTQATEASVSAIVDRCDGNPLFAEELMRTSFQHHDDLPLAIQAAMQTRLDVLPPAAKTAALTASVLGRTVWQEAIGMMLPDVDVAMALDVLQHRELLAGRPRSRFSGTRELMFRSSLLREAAYAMLTEEDKASHHRIAGSWLRGAGEKRQAVLAHHFARGGELAEATQCYLAAAEHSFQQADAQLALEHAVNGIAISHEDSLSAALQVIAARACHLLGRYEAALVHSAHGQAVTSDSVLRLELASARCLTLRRLGQLDTALVCIQSALARADHDDAVGLKERLHAQAELSWTFYNAGDPAAALKSACVVLAEPAAKAPGMIGIRLSAAHVRARAEHSLGHLDAALASHQAVVERASELGYHWRGEGARNGLGQVLMALGRHEEAREELGRARDNAHARNLPSTRGWANVFLTLLQLRLGDRKAAERAAFAGLEIASALEAGPLRAACQTLVALVALRGDDHAGALQHAQRARTIDTIEPDWALLAEAIESMACVRAGQVETGLDQARRCAASLTERPSILEAFDAAASLLLDALGRGGRAEDLARLESQLKQELQRRLDAVHDSSLHGAIAAAVCWHSGAAD